MNAKRMTEIGLLLEILGGLAIALGAFLTAQASRSFNGASDDQRRREKLLYVAGGILLAVGAGLQLLAVITREVPAT